MFDKIILAVDGSENSKKAIEYAKSLVKTFNSKIYILSAYNYPLYYTENIEAYVKEKTRSILTETASYFVQDGLQVEKFMEEGNSGKVICELAEQEDVDLIIMGKEGYKDLKSLLIGSTCNYVIHHSKKTVFLV